MTNVLRGPVKYLFYIYTIWVIGVFSLLLTHLSEFSPQFLFFLKGLYHTSCHQLPERTFILWNTPLLVCCRCLGIYLGSLISFVVFATFRFNKPSIFVIFALIVPLILDVSRLLLHIGSYSKSIGFISGSIFGVAVSGLIYSVIKESPNK